MLAGTPGADKDVLELARLLRNAGFEDVAERLEGAWDAETKVLGSPSTTANASSAGSTIRRPDSRNCAAFCSWSTSGGYVKGSGSPRWAGLFARDKRHRLAPPRLSIGGARCTQ